MREHEKKKISVAMVKWRNDARAILVRGITLCLGKA